MARYWALPPLPSLEPIIVTALHDYNPPTSHDQERLAFKQGDRLEIMGKPGNEDAWWYVRHKESGQQGYIPSNYVRCEVPDSEEWWWSVDRTEAERMLSGQGYPRGTFLVRPSSEVTSYALSVRDFDDSENGQIRHYKIKVFSNGTCSPSGCPTMKFTSVANLVMYFRGSNEGLCHRIVMPCPASDQVWIDSLVAQDDIDYIPNLEAFDCPICFDEVKRWQGMMLRGCYHKFCMPCLKGYATLCQDAIMKCPHGGENACDNMMQHREIRAAVDEPVFLNYLARSLTIAEGQAPNSFHCQTTDCPNWCILDGNTQSFDCDVCKKSNCINCTAVHTGQSCQEYQQRAAANDEAAVANQELLQELMDKGDAMECPSCRIIVQKVDGCDWLVCSRCQTEICWVTKGPRWGPKGRGDISGGCKCRVGGKACHPNCNTCH